MLTRSRLRDGTNHGVVIKELETFDIITVATKRFSTLTIQHLGRVLVAGRDFEVGDLVLRESPLVWFSDTQNLIVKFLSEMTETDREDMLSMFHFDSSQETTHESCKRSMTQLAEEAHRLHGIWQRKHQNEQISSELIFKCLSIANLNAHSFYPNDSEPNRAALFPAAAIISHSCRPNTIYAIEQSCIEYYAARPIRCGEEITSTYLSWSDLVTCTTAQRREKLLASKDFVCLCARCEGPDLGRGVPCRRGSGSGSGGGSPRSCSGVSYPSCSGSGRGRGSGGPQCQWLCAACGSRKKSVQSGVERDLEQEHQRLLRDCSLSSSSSSSSSTEWDLLAEAAAQQLSPAHSVTVRTVLAAAALMEREAEALAGSDFYAAREWRLLAVRRLEQFVRAMECVEAHCPRVRTCLPSGRAHGPAVSAVKEVADIWVHSARSHEAPPAWLPSYLPLLAVFYGARSSLVRDVKRSYGLSEEERGCGSGSGSDSAPDFRAYCKQS